MTGDRPGAVGGMIRFIDSSGRESQLPEGTPPEGRYRFTSDEVMILDLPVARARAEMDLRMAVTSPWMAMGSP